MGGGQVRKGNKYYFMDITLRCKHNLRESEEYDYPVQIFSAEPLYGKLERGDILIVRGWLEVKGKLFRINADWRNVRVLKKESPLNQKRQALDQRQEAAPLYESRPDFDEEEKPISDEDLPF